MPACTVDPDDASTWTGCNVSPPHCDLTVQLVRRDAGGSVLATSGDLSLRSVGPLGMRLRKALADAGRLLVDVSGLRPTWAPATQVFPSVLGRTGGWPQARLVLFGAGPELTRLLEAQRVPLQVPLAADETAAWELLDRRPPIVVRTTELEHARESARRARLFVDAACTDWQLDVVRNDALVVASELVANAVLHACTTSRLTLRYRERGLTIAVYDRRPDLVLPLRSAVETRQGHGLFMVEALSLHWGVREGRDEKCVWAFLPATTRVTCSGSVRQAAHDAVRAVLAHGADSVDARAGRQQLVARLAERHGPDLVRDVADELAAELAEAATTDPEIAPSG